MIDLTENMARNCNHSAALDHVPELWTEILKRVPELDRSAIILRVVFLICMLYIIIPPSSHPPPNAVLCRLCHVPLVSRRLRKACRDPCLWPELRVLLASFRTEARWRSFLGWLTVRSPGLQTFVFSEEVEWVTPSPPSEIWLHGTARSIHTHCEDRKHVSCPVRDGPRQWVNSAGCLSTGI